MTSEKLPSGVIDLEKYEKLRQKVRERHVRAEADAREPGEATVPEPQDDAMAEVVQFEPAPEAESLGRVMTRREHLEAQIENLSGAIANEVRRHEDNMAALEAALHRAKMELMDDDMVRMKGGVRDAA